MTTFATHNYPSAPPTRRAVALLCCIYLMFGAQGARADSAGPTLDYPAPVNNFEIEGGHLFNFASSPTNASYFRISYKGQLLDSSGVPVVDAAHEDLSAPAPPTASGTSGGDRNKYSFRFENGSVKGDAGLFEGEGLEQIVLRGLESLQLRGTAWVGGDAQAKKLQFAGGLESRPFHLPALGDRGIANWLVLGVNGQHQTDTEASGTNSTFGLVTYHVFLGKALWRKGSAEAVKRLAAQIENSFLHQAPTLEDAKKVRDTINANNTSQHPASDAQLAFKDAVDEAESGGGNWVKAVEGSAQGIAQEKSEQPVLALYMEDSGYYALTQQANTGRLRNLLTATADYWFMPSSDSLLLRLRYENGYERATPTLRKDRLLLYAVVRF